MLRLQSLLGPVCFLALACGLALTVIGFSDLSSGQDVGRLWLWSDHFLKLFAWLMLAAAIAGLVRGPVIGGTAIMMILVMALGYVVPLIAVMALGMSAFALGRLILRSPEEGVTGAILIGTAVFGTLLGLLVYFPVNTPGTWAVLFGLPLLVIWGRPSLFDFTMPPKPKLGLHQYLLFCAISAAAMLHVLGAMMPEIGSDALAVHLFVAAHVAYHAEWHFDIARYTWAVMPMFVDWLYAAGYMYAGETGARFVNVGGILLLAAQIHRMSRWAGANETAAGWAALLFLLTPLSFTESSSLFIEGIWSALVIAGSLALFRLITADGKPTVQIISGGMLLGAAMAAKAVAAAFLPILVGVMLVTIPKWYRNERLPAIACGLLLFLTMASIPYVGAYLIAGNPLFPFLNAYFQSPFYPAVNFEAPFTRGFAFDTLYQMTFDSTRYLEGKVGSAGFHWLLLVVPGILALAFGGCKRGLLVALTAAGWLWLAFEQTAYLRYIFPVFALSCVIAALLLTSAEKIGKPAGFIVILVLLATVVLDTLHLSAGTNNFKVNWEVIRSERARDAYIRDFIPLRAIVSATDALNVNSSPVAFFSPPFAAELRAEALHNSWYNPSFQDAVARAKDDIEFGRSLARENADYLIVDEDAIDDRIKSYLTKVSYEILQINTISLRRLNYEYRFFQELLPSTDFSAGWELADGAQASQGLGAKVTVSAPAFAEVPAKPGEIYHYEAVARCAGSAGMVRAQVNWLDADGKFVSTNIQVFDCGMDDQTYEMELVAPDGAATAIFYASAHTDLPVVFSRVSFKN